MSTRRRIRDVAETDSASIAAIHGYYVVNSVLPITAPSPLSPEQWRARIVETRRAGHPMLVALEDDVVVGYAELSRWLGHAVFSSSAEDSVYVAPSALRRGHGGRLLDVLLEKGRDVGFREVVAVIADADDEGRASRALHLDAGFLPAGQLRRIAHKRGRWIDLTLLQRTLGPRER
ncbi:GNAT family N-acetyltransferase [Actinomycetospora atypica]|uniref:GNAT family N-acetyltransferase n=1 Tax=Actinomycetospora atypica TaxID=1290095 RepID=A0ABV9YGK6_9PSEU